MSADIYTYPEEVGDPPVIDFSNREQSIDEMLAPEREWEDTLKAWVREHGQGDLAGEEVSWQRGDGYARYVVYTEKPLRLIHIPTGDGWQVEEIFTRGLVLADIRAEVERKHKLDELFGRSTRR